VTNTYLSEDDLEFKQVEELRCIRCVLERLLRAKYPQEFVDYQMEKFGKNYKSKGLKK